MAKELKIDIHTHILPRDLPNFYQKFGYGGWIRLEHHKEDAARMIKGDTFFREIKCNCWEGRKRLEECDTHSVDVQVLSTIPVMFSYWAQPEHCMEVSKFLNDDLAKVVAEDPARFVGLGTIPMQAPEMAVEELRRCVSELGFAGVQIGSHVNEWNLNDPALFPIFEEAEKLGACIFVHPWDMMGEDEMKKYWLPWLVGMPAETSRAMCSMIFGGVLERLPKLRVCFAHAGGAFPGTIGRIEHGFNVRPDLCAIDNPVNPREYCKRIWVDSLCHDPAVFPHIVNLFGKEKIMLGTDYPFPLGELKPGEVIETSEYDAETKRMMLGTNAISWLGKAGERLMEERKKKGLA